MEPAEVTRGGSQVGRVVWQCGRKGPWPATDGNLGSEHVTWAAVSVDRRARQRPGQGWGLSPHLTSKLLLVLEASTPGHCLGGALPHPCPLLTSTSAFCPGLGGPQTSLPQSGALP